MHAKVTRAMGGLLMDIYRVICCKVIHVKVARAIGGLPMDIYRMYIL